MCKNGQTVRFLVCLIWCLFLTGFSEAASQWALTMGGLAEDELYSAQRTNDGNIILAGETYSFGTGSYNGWCVKLDASGNVLWQKLYGGAGYDSALAVRATSDGGYVLAGHTSSFGAGNRDAWIVKLDASGNAVWQKAYGGASAEYAYAIRETPDGGYILAGVTFSFGAGGEDAWCLRLDASGNVVWQKTYGGANSDSFWDVQLTADGGYIVTGDTRSYGAGSVEAWCIKLDGSGNVQWQKTYGGASIENGKRVFVTADGGYLVCGETISFGLGDCDFWCLKLDVYGNIQWQKAYGGIDAEYFDGADMTSDGGCVLAGRTKSFGAGSTDAWCVKLDLYGNIQWQKTYGGVSWDKVDGVLARPDGGYVVCGSTGSFDSEGNGAGWCLKLDSAGDIDPSCANLVQNSPGYVLDTTGLVGFPLIVGVPISATVTEKAATSADSTAVPVVLCSGGTAGPTITSITSKTSKPGSTATINGTGFSTDKKQDVVYFGSKKVQTIKRAKATSLKVTIPRVKKGTVGVYVLANGEKSNTFQFVVK